MVGKWVLAGNGPGVENDFPGSDVVAGIRVREKSATEFSYEKREQANENDVAEGRQQMCG